MTIVQQLIDKLSELPPDAKVEVLKEVFRGFDNFIEWTPLDIDNVQLLGDTLRLGED